MGSPGYRSFYSYTAGTGQGGSILAAVGMAQSNRYAGPGVASCLLPPFAARGLRAIHASSVEVNGAGVLITGESGSGKTTSALKVVENGGRLIADDMTFFSRHDGDTFVIHGMGEAPRARKEVWEQFKQWSPVPRKRSSKLILKSDDLPWSKEAPLKRMIILVERDSGENYKVKLLTTLLSLTYLDILGLQR